MKLISRISKGNFVTDSNYNFLTACTRHFTINVTALMASVRCYWISSSNKVNHRSYLSAALSQSNVLTPTTHKINNLQSITTVIDTAKAVKATYFTLPKLNLVHCQLGRDCVLYAEN